MIKILYHKTNLKQSYLDINSKEEFPKLYESFNNAKEFIDKSLKGILINNKTNNLQNILKLVQLFLYIIVIKQLLE